MFNSLGLTLRSYKNRSTEINGSSKIWNSHNEGVIQAGCEIIGYLIQVSLYASNDSTKRLDAFSLGRPKNKLENKKDLENQYQ